MLVKLAEQMAILSLFTIGFEGCVSQLALDNAVMTSDQITTEVFRPFQLWYSVSMA